MSSSPIPLETQLSFCSACWRTIPTGAGSCPGCGTDLAALTARPYTEKLLATLEHPIGEVGERAASLLGEVAGHEAREPLTRLAEKSSDPYLAAAALRGLCRCNPIMRAESEATRQVMWRLLRPIERDYLGTLPIQADVLLGGLRFHLVHATPSDPLYTYVRPDERERWEEELAKIDADILLVGHTHLPMVLRFGRRLIVNPGSVGQPRDGDPRASYVLIEDGEPRLARAAYDIEATIRGLQGGGLPSSIFERLARILRTGSVTGG
jgi:diadenosine tetraphosphatase ApaH/serine/threonine PP2A family protein phosphatase